MTVELPAFFTPSPEREALERGLDQVIFDPLDKDERQRRETNDGTSPLRAYLLLDASQSSDIPICLEGFSNSARCLFDGQAYDDLAEVAPWLVELTRYSDVWDWFVEEGYGNNWGIIIHSRLELPRLKTHLKRFLKVEDEDGDISFFKFYRPKHFNTYVPKFDNKQRELFWRRIETVYAEKQEDAQLLYLHTLDSDGNYSDEKINLINIGEPMLTHFALQHENVAHKTVAKVK